MVEKSTLLFVFFALVVWMVIVSYMVRQENPEAAAPFRKMAFSNRGLLVLVVCLFVSHYIFSEDKAPAIPDAASVRVAEPFVPSSMPQGMGTMVPESLLNSSTSM
jgi:hypothetical protein